MRELREGWTEIRAHRRLAPMVVQFAAVNALTAAPLVAMTAGARGALGVVAAVLPAVSAGNVGGR